MVIHFVFKGGREFRKNCTKEPKKIELSYPMVQFLFYLECVVFSHHPSPLASLG